MPKPSKGQKKTVGRVMHKYKHGELKSGKGGKGGKVRSRKQAIAIAMHEAGISRKKRIEINSSKQKGMSRQK